MGCRVRLPSTTTRQKFPTEEISGGCLNACCEATSGAGREDAAAVTEQKLADAETSVAER